MVSANTGCAATGIGITAAVLGMLGGILACLWFLISELWDIGILRFILVGNFALAAVLAFISGVIYATFLPTGTAGAACAWQFFCMALCAVSAFFCFKAGGGGTAS